MFAFAKATGMKPSLEMFQIKKDGTFVCYEWDYAAGLEAVVSTHVKYVHKRIRDQKCNVCDYSTAWKEDLESHVMLVHEKSYKCIECDYAFAVKQVGAPTVSSTVIRGSN
jgi:hypothetical protein